MVLIFQKQVNVYDLNNKDRHTALLSTETSTMMHIEHKENINEVKELGKEHSYLRKYFT